MWTPAILCYIRTSCEALPQGAPLCYLERQSLLSVSELQLLAPASDSMRGVVSVSAYTSAQK